ncbi:hypothetical protein BGW36DRAFT_136995 [Talaromyces proteolyticus]|uniref:RNA recognition motif-containing protein n=1 Tax=Talaromyces proteolyticus TaxID=1131652 RepID=A0AAD4KVP0_9EURO|nr:uncharacterized protein BGW36DRAFT_136995 [Talaromyces proteolyticus]KAH8700840.1 hypothetical protein BGW36DRAFT_136995 [Talaromyces proteolyticus]
MPPLAGEDRVLTVFADLHYYFTSPTPQPVYHRFDKGSYLYVYYDAVRGSARVEVANNPGTSDQDAFHGALDHVHIIHSTRFPTLCTLTVGAQAENSPVSAHSPIGAQEQWLLPFTDPRNNKTRRFRLHTLDIYFWTTEDADQFLDAVQRAIPAAQLETNRPQAQAESPAVSAVVEKLENVAVSDPSYQNGQTRNSQSEPQPAANETPNQPTANYAPLVYNPAAPAAPEPIKYREETPPPMDGGEGTGLAAAVAADQGLYHPQTQIQGSLSQTQAQTVPGLPQYGYSSPPPSAGFPPTQPFPGTPGIRAPSYSSAPTVQAGGMNFAPPPQNPNAHLFAQDAHDVHQGQAPPQYSHTPHNSQSGSYGQAYEHSAEDERVAIGGYSNYSYAQPVLQHTGSFGSEYDIHSQVYRPTEYEAKSDAVKHANKAMANPNSRHHKLEERAGKVENKVNGFLKRLEKSIG